MHFPSEVPTHFKGCQPIPCAKVNSCSESISHPPPKFYIFKPGKAKAIWACALAPADVQSWSALAGVPAGTRERLAGCFLFVLLHIRLLPHLHTAGDCANQVSPMPHAAAQPALLWGRFPSFFHRIAWKMERTLLARGESMPGWAAERVFGCWETDFPSWVWNPGFPTPAEI